VDEVVGNLVWSEALLGLGALVVAIGGGLVLVRRQLRPLREVADTALRVTALPLSSGEIGTTVRVPEDLTDERTEVGQMGAALNTMLAHVEDALDERHRSELQVARRWTSPTSSSRPSATPGSSGRTIAGSSTFPRTRSPCRVTSSACTRC
jgi:HAMP domain-containing protein